MTVTGFEDDSRNTEGSVWNILLDAALNPSALDRTARRVPVVEAVTAPPDPSAVAVATVRTAISPAVRRIRPTRLGDRHHDGRRPARSRRAGGLPYPSPERVGAGGAGCVSR